MLYHQQRNNIRANDHQQGNNTNYTIIRAATPLRPSAGQQHQLNRQQNNRGRYHFWRNCSPLRIDLGQPSYWTLILSAISMTKRRHVWQTRDKRPDDTWSTQQQADTPAKRRVDAGPASATLARRPPGVWCPLPAGSYRRGCRYQDDAWTCHKPGPGPWGVLRGHLSLYHVWQAKPLICTLPYQTTLHLRPSCRSSVLLKLNAIYSRVWKLNIAHNVYIGSSCKLLVLENVN